MALVKFSRDRQKTTLQRLHFRIPPFRMPCYPPMKTVILLVSSVLLLSSPLAHSAAGGGYINSGITGQYFNNLSLSGTACFTRNEVRVDFDWGTVGLPGGSNSPGFSSITSNAFSVLWSGKFIPKYSEIYTFKTITTGGVTVTHRNNQG